MSPPRTTPRATTFSSSMECLGRSLDFREEHSVVAFRQQLAEETAVRDAARLALQRLSRSVDFYRQRLRMVPAASRPGDYIPEHGGAEATCLATSGGAQRARELLRSLEAEVRSAVTPESAALSMRVDGPESPSRVPGGQSYEVLRRSLEDAQRRCESLNSDMVQQAEANEELVEHLGKVKDANKRLLEQIRLQTDEIAQLTQQRVTDEERMDHLAREHQADHEVFRQQTHRRIMLLREAMRERSEALRHQLTERMRYTKSRLQIIFQDAARLAEEHKRLRRDAGAMTDAMREHLKVFDKEASSRCGTTFGSLLGRVTTAREAVGCLEECHRTERDLRQSEGLAANNKLAALAADKQDAQARMARDLSQLTSNFQGAQRVLTCERQAWAEEKARLESRVTDAAQRLQTKKADLDRLQCDIVRLETAVSSADAASRMQEHTVEELRKQIRLSDDSLAGAVSANEHLREQIEEQRRRCQDKSEQELEECRAACELRLSDAKAGYETEAVLSARQLQAIEDEAAKEDDSRQVVGAQADAMEEDVNILRRDVSLWTTQYQEARMNREALEAKLSDQRQFFAPERLRLQGAIDKHSTSITEAEEQIVRIKAQIDASRRESTERETRHATQTSATELGLRDAREQLADLRRRVSEMTQAKARVESDSSGSRHRSLELQQALEKTREARRLEVQDERVRCAELIAAEVRATELIREEFERERESNLQTLRRMHDDSRSKLTQAERERQRIEETCKHDSSTAGEELMQRQQRCEALEGDLNRLRYLLSESDANLVWMRQEFDREERDAQLIIRRLTDEVQAADATVEKSAKEDVQLQRQLEELAQRGEQERQRLCQELEDVRHSAMINLASADSRVQRAKADHESEMREHEQLSRSLLSAERRREESLERENAQLRSFIAEQSHTSAGLSSLHNKIESQIQGLQRRTEELRSSIQTGTSVTGTKPPAAIANGSAAGSAAGISATSRLRGGFDTSSMAPSPIYASPPRKAGSGAAGISGLGTSGFGASGLGASGLGASGLASGLSSSFAATATAAAASGGGYPAITVGDGGSRASGSLTRP